MRSPSSDPSSLSRESIIPPSFYSANTRPSSPSAPSSTPSPFENPCTLELNGIAPIGKHQYSDRGEIYPLIFPSLPHLVHKKKKKKKEEDRERKEREKRERERREREKREKREREEREERECVCVSE
jgi:hypothetical protein